MNDAKTFEKWLSNTILGRMNEAMGERFDERGFFRGELRDAHRSEFSDLQWASVQPEGPARFKVGDVVMFRAGGSGVVNEVSASHNGWPASYSVSRIDGVEYHPQNVAAWHYDGDLEGKGGAE